MYYIKRSMYYMDLYCIQLMHKFHKNISKICEDRQTEHIFKIHAKHFIQLGNNTYTSK